MKVIVIVRFKDKYTDMWHEANEELSINLDRYNEIKRFVKVLDADNQNKKQKRKGKSHK